MDANNSKPSLRQTLRRRRDELTTARRPLALESLTAHRAWQQSQCVASYLPTGSEQSPHLIDNLVLSSGRTLAYPRVTGHGQMVFRQHTAQGPLETGAYGIKAPPESAPAVDVQSIDLFLVPLLACDDRGYRLGYGGGYYDRILSVARGFRCGVGFSFQRVPTLPSEQHDVCVHAFLSERTLELFN